MKTLTGSLLLVAAISYNLTVVASVTTHLSKPVFIHSINSGSLRNSYRLPAIPVKNNYGTGSLGFSIETGASNCVAFESQVSSKSDQAQQPITVNPTGVQHPALQQFPPRQKPSQQPRPFPHPKPKPDPYPTPFPNPNPGPKPLPKPIPEPTPQPVPEPQPIK